MNDILKNKKTIVWLTADYFVDCDIEMIKHLSDYYHIYWHIILPAKGSRFSQFEITNWQLTNVEIKLHSNKYRLRNPASLLYFRNIFKKLAKTPYDVLYLNYTPSPFFALASFKILDPNKTIVTAHQGEIYSGFRFKSIYQSTYNLFYSYYRYINMFSKSETQKHIRQHPKSTVFTIPLALKHFGNSENLYNNETIRFLIFGSIRPTKNIGLLIEASCNLYQNGVHNFNITIAGECDNWNQYKNKIKYPQIFNLAIRRIPNKEIANLFCQHHYLVLPYKIVTQSGPLKIAYNYNIPVIASNLPGFSDEIINNETGYLFESENVEDLTKVISRAIDTHNQNYRRLKQNLAKYVKNRYSDEEIKNKYISMFETIIGSNYQP